MPKIKTIRREGGSRVLTVTNFIPKDWQAVIVSKVKKSNDIITVVFEKVR